MIRPARASTSDPITGRKPFDAFTQRLDDPSRGVPDRSKRDQALAREGNRRSDALDPRPLDGLAHQVGTRTSLREQILLAELDLAALGTGTNH